MNRRLYDGRLHPTVIQFEQTLKAEGVQACGRYAVQVSAFVRWMEAGTATPFVSAAVTRNDILIYLDTLIRRRPLSRSAGITSMLRRFFRYEQESGRIATSPMDGV